MNTNESAAGNLLCERLAMARCWKAAPAVLSLLCLSASIAADAPRNTSAMEQLKPGKGRELVQANCIPCNSTAIIAANHLGRAKWDEIITKMQQKNGMWPILPAVRSQILDYLETAQRPEDAGLEKGKETPWATPLYRPNPLW
jgi:hypothetical protein